MLQRYRLSLWNREFKRISAEFSPYLSFHPTSPDCCYAYYVDVGVDFKKSPLLTWAKWEHPFSAGSWQLFFTFHLQNDVDLTLLKPAVLACFGYLLVNSQVRNFYLYTVVAKRYWEELSFLASNLGLNFHFMSLSRSEDLLLARMDLDRLTYRGIQWGIMESPLGKIAVFGGEDYVQEITFLPEDENDTIENSWLQDRFVYLQQLAALSDSSDEENCLNRTSKQTDLPVAVLSAMQQLQSYFSGELKKLDFPISFARATDFQREIWSILEEIPRGATMTYLELAQLYLERTGACDKSAADDLLVKARELTRAVGAACAANPLPIRLPCHRVVGQNGKLVGYRGGIKIKESLLDHELWGY